MRDYIDSEFLKEKREKHLFLGIICVIILSFVFWGNSYKLTGNANVLDLYCDNMEIHFFITLFFVVIYTIVLFADEYRYGTIYQLELIQASQEKLFLAKMFFVFFFTVLVMTFTTIISVIIVGIRGFDLAISYISVLLFINLVDAILVTFVMTPIAFVVVLCKGNYISSLLISICYILLCFTITSFPISQTAAQKLMAYGHPLGSYALIHNWLIFKLVPYETSMLLKPRENEIVAFVGISVWGIISFILSVIVMRKKRGK